MFHEIKVKPGKTEPFQILQIVSHVTTMASTAVDMWKRRLMLFHQSFWL